MSFIVGSTIRLRAQFRHPLGHASAGALFDPSSVSIKVGTPVATTGPKRRTVTIYVYPTDADVVKEATGIYHIDVLLGLVGDWVYRWITVQSGKTASLQRSVIAERNAL